MDIRQLGARRLGMHLPWISFGIVEGGGEREKEGGEGSFGEVTLMEEGFKFGRILERLISILRLMEIF